MKRLVEVPTLTPAELAQEFWNMKDDEQADFFNALARLVPEPWNLRRQMCYVANHGFLSPAGREVMTVIGEGG